MGGHSRRSKQSAKSSSTVLCDFPATLEAWKQQIKVKDSIPANQQRLTFASQRSAKQHFALAKLNPSRQWQVVVDASAEEVCKDLRNWRATLRSNNISGELLQPLVLKETDELAAFLHSRTADELREIGVPCSVFFLSFKEWIPILQTKQCNPSNREPIALDLKIDEEFRENLFFIDLYGDLKGLAIPIPLKYVMNGSQLATKLFMVEQTAQYREEHKQRYQQLITPTLKGIDAESSEASSIEANCQSSCSNDYVLEIEQDCEFTAFISREHHRLRCIVLPVITIPLVERKGNEELPFLCLPRRGIREGSEESSSNLLALPSTSEIGEVSTIVARSLVEEVHSSATPDKSTRKNTKKKRKKKPRKAVRENVRSSTHLGQNAIIENQSSCLGALMKHSQEDVVGDAANCLNAETVTRKDVEDEVHLKPYNKLKHGSRSLMADLKDHSLDEVDEIADSSEQRDFLAQLGRKQIGSSTGAESNFVSDSVSPGGHEHIKQGEGDCASDQYHFVMDSKKQPELFLGTDQSDDTLKVDSASVQMPASFDCNINTDIKDHPAAHGILEQRVINTVESTTASGCDSGSHRISKPGGMKRVKESIHRNFQSEISTTVNRQVVGDCSANNSNLQNERGDHARTHTRSIQQSFWTHTAAESHDCLPHRTRVNQNSYTSAESCESRSSAPFWRHRRDDIAVSSHSWTKPKPSRADEWSLSRRFPSPSSSRQSRNMQTWEQLPNLRQPLNGSTFPIHWENRNPLDSRPWSLSSRGQSYSSFNMQQRKLGKSIKVSQRYSDKWQAQVMPNDRITPNMRFSTMLPSTSSVSSVMKAESISNLQTLSTKDFGKDSNFVHGPILGSKFEGKTESSDHSDRGALESGITVQTTPETVNSSQSEQWLSVPGKSGLQLPKSQVAQHVCEILEAVNASYESWVFYELVSRLNGKSLCEFERVARAVAPTFKASMSQQNREPTGCVCETEFSRSKCPKQIPDVQLSTVWQWYEEPSSYGLKVKLSESSKRTGSNLQAFFVPYLSAIQLFGWSRKKSITGSKDTVTARGVSPFDPHFLSQPLLSILLPRPETDDDVHTSEVLSKHVGTSLKSIDSAWADEGTVSSSGRQCHCDVELLYEFFEVEKPQQRKPLTDRIKELASHLEPSSGGGDAQLLNSAKIEDLHPSSWFSVAWYPIYKIPDETFRSAFLTYHSLSCLPSAFLGSMNANHSVDDCVNTVTAPVVGLMSYNAQAKDWFSLSPSCDASPDDVLQQYLCKLETAAATMARGSCEKLSGFKHADFSFFQSRGR